MKNKILTLTACALLGCWSGAFAENPDAPMPPKPPQGGKPPREKMRDRMLENLPPEIRERFQAAREKAIQDPKIQALRQNADKANEEFFKAMREKMQEIDPGLGELIKKQAGGGGKDGGKGWKDRKEDGGGPPPGPGGLNDAEREKFQAARDKAKSDPAVIAAEKKKDEAKTPEERRAAGEEFRKAMKDAILKADPSVAPLLEKLGPPPPPPRPPGPGGDGEMEP
ncbi:MAG: hypothetical protein ACOYMS_06070 [Terrimicrobiaceae bacterium]